MKKQLLSVFALAALLFASAASFAQTSYTLITSSSELEAGAQYLLVGFDEDGNAYAMSYQKPNNRHAISISESGGVITTTVATDPNSQTEPFEFTLGGSTGQWTIFDPLNNGYLNAPGGGNYLKTQDELTDNGKWVIDIDNNGACMPTSNGGVEQCYMRFNYNNGSPLFGCYKESSTVIAPVYFFKAGGSVTPDPEPTNYPTNFTATANGLDVTVTWTDATGGQLPSKYLVLASTGTLWDLPQDGTVYPNDDMTLNVAYGVQSATFTNFSGNTTYYFYIFPYTNSGVNIDYKTDGNYPSTSATTDDIVYLLNENFEGGDLGVFVSYDMYGDQNWHNASYGGNHYAYMNGYASGSAHANEDWLISYAMYGEYESVTLEFKTARKFDGNNLSLLISNDYDGVSEPTEYEWTELTDMFDWSPGEYEWIESGVVDIHNFTGERFYIAFVYTSTDENAASWELDDVKVVARGLLSVNEQPKESFVVHPNPANDNIRFELAEAAQVTVFDLCGRTVAESHMSAGMATLGVANLENGVYFLNVRYADGKKEIARFVKF